MSDERKPATGSDVWAATLCLLVVLSLWLVALEFHLDRIEQAIPACAADSLPAAGTDGGTP